MCSKDHTKRQQGSPLVHHTVSQCQSSLPISKKDEKFVSLAIDECMHSTMLMKHGCVVVQNNRVVSKGHNSLRNQFRDNFIGTSCSCHAEMHALRAALRLAHKGKRTPFRARVGQRLLYEKVALL